MAKHLRPPDKLWLEGNLKENFRRFQQSFNLYMVATGLNDKGASVNLVKDHKKEAKKPFNSKQKDKRADTSKTCNKCGTRHEPRKCPAYGKVCHGCGIKNHFKRKCRSKQKQVQNVDTDDTSEDEYFGLLFDTINAINSNWKIDCRIENKDTVVLADTGAKCNVISKRLLKGMNVKPKLKESSVVLRTFSGHTIKPLGSVILNCTIKNQTYRCKFQVVQDRKPTILGGDTCEKMGLIKKCFSVKSKENSDLLETYSDVFEGIGCLPGKHKIDIDPSVTPKIHPPRKVPLKLEEKVKQELKRMENDGIIAKETEPTDWVSSMVTVVKPDGRVRKCLDPKDLNTAVKCQHYPLKTVEEIIAKIPGATYFSKLDATSSFWQIESDEESSKLCTFNSPFGRYRYLRLPMVVHSAPVVMQRFMTQMFEDIEGAAVIMDDILVAGRTLQEHDERLKQVVERACKNNLKLNKEKCLIRKTEVPYVGHLLTKDGVKPDPEKVKTVECMVTPKHKNELMTFLGFIKYLAKFIPNLSDKSADLRKLLQKDIMFEWGHEQQKCFEELKRSVTSASVLKYFDPRQPITLTVDSSSKAVGAALLQNEQPVAYASQSLTKTQQNYSQLEKETLAILFAVRRFRQYIFGQHVKVESDHKPLQTIFRRAIYENPLRLQ